MDTRNRKIKGYKQQKWIRNKILEIFTTLEEDDVRPTSMSANGEDVLFSPAARRLLPIQIEAKHLARSAIYKIYDQAKSHGDHEPVVMLRANHKKTLAVVDAEYFLELLKKVNEKN